MENNKKYFRTLNFDLSDDKLKQYYPKATPHNCEVNENMI